MPEKPSCKKIKTTEDYNNLDDSDDEDFIAPLVDLDICQEKLDKLNEKVNEEGIAMDQKSRNLRQECYDKRSKIIDQIPGFWFTVFTSHPDICSIITEEEEQCLSYLHKLEVDMADNGSSYSIKFSFRENPFFKNRLLVKKIVHNQDTMASESTKIDWVKPQKKTVAKKVGKKREREEPESFFEWFANNDDPASDRIAEIIKDQIWVNSLNYYLPDFDINWEDGSSGISEGEEESDETNDDMTAQAPGNGTS